MHEPSPGVSKQAGPPLVRSTFHLFVWPMLAAMALHLVFQVKYASRFGGEPDALVCVAPARVGQPPYEAVTHGVGRDGYDGQYYYALARNPWARHDAGIDVPAARQLRILYPAICCLLSGGDPVRLFWV